MNEKCQTFEPIKWSNGAVVMIDQRFLPNKEIYNDYTDVPSIAEAIRNMVIRGAPAIGIAAAYGIALAAHNNRKTPGKIVEKALGACDMMAVTRPTAVNLFWAIKRMKKIIDGNLGKDPSSLPFDLLEEAKAIHSEDLELCRSIGRHGAELVKDGSCILTHCNTGALATGGHGTALGVIRSAVEAGKKITVLADETRPFLQGARLTAWELLKDNIDVTVIADVAAASLMARGKVDLVIVGTDRVTANGDVANKIGTYSVALAAKANNIPFYVAAPWSTIDLDTPSGAEIKIENRPEKEVTHVFEERVVPEGVPALNPAFDITPSSLVTALITDRGVVRAPYLEQLKKFANHNV